MSGVDNRIVTMQFNNRDFETNARTSLSTMQKLKESMNFGSIAGSTIRSLGAISNALSKIGLHTPFAPMIKAANTGLAGVGLALDKLGLKNPFGSTVQGIGEVQRAAQTAGGPAGMGVLEGGVVAVSSKFVALATIAITALSNITNRAINSTTAWVKSFTVAPIMDGLNEYQTTLQSIQTVQANTDRPLPEIEAALQRLNAYSDTTIYNFGQMAKNVGTFTAAGVDLETSVASIQGIANIAALSGSSADQAATAMYQLSQAIASGKVGLMDWNSVVNAGMGGKKLQNALLQTAVAMGKIEASSVKLVGPMDKLTVGGKSFRESIMAQPGQESWLSSDILVNTLASLDGRFSVAYQKAQLTAQGVRKFTDAQIKSNMIEARANLEKKNGVKYSDEQYAALLKMAQASTSAAQDVKTLGQVFDIAKETIGSGWAASFKSIFGNLKESKTLFTGMSNGLGDLIRANALARNKLLVAWKKAGGRDTLIEGLKDAWKSFYSVIQAVSKGFRDVFPKATAKDLVGLTQKFADFMQKLRPSKDTLASIREIAGGVAAVFHIVGQVIGGVVAGFKALFNAAGAGNGDFLSFLAGLAGSIKNFDAFLEKSGIITKFFVGLAQILTIPLALLKGVASAIGSLFEGFNLGKADAATGALKDASDNLSGLKNAGDGIHAFFAGLSGMFEGLGKAIGRGLAGIGDLIASFLTSESFQPALDAINTGLFAALTVAIVGFFKGGAKIDLTGGIFSNIGKTVGEANKTLSALQTSLKADALLKIGIAIGVIAASLFLLSTIDPGALRKALFAMAAGLALLIAAMSVMSTTLGAGGVVKIYILANALIAMAAAILLMAVALKVMASIEFGDMLRGLVGLSLMLIILNKAMAPLAANSKGMMRAAASLILVGIAINLLAVALKIFATMTWEEMIKGLAGLTGVLLALSIGLRSMPNLQSSALSLIALGIALNLIAVAMKVFATMSWEDMAKGLVGITGALLGISLAINTMPKTMMLQAAALVVVSAALLVLSGVMKVFGAMSWEAMAKGLIMLGGSLLVIGLSLKVIGADGILGATALMAVAVAMAVLLPVLVAFGAMDWTTILKSLTMLAAVFVILGVAGYALAPVVLVIIGLGAAMLLLGAGLALAGAGALLAATAFGIVVAAGAAGIHVLVGLLAAIIAAIPPALKAFGEGVVQFAVAIGQGAPEIAKAFGQILSNFLDQVIKNAPKVANAILAMLRAVLKVLRKAIPEIAETGLKMIIGFLQAISKHLPEIIDLGANIIVKFLQGLGRNAHKIMDAAAKMILDFMHGIAKVIRERSDDFANAGWDIASAIVEGMVSGLKALGHQIKDVLMGFAKDAWNSVKDFFSVGSPSKLMEETIGRPIVQGWALGISESGHLPVKAVEDVGNVLITKMSRIMSGVEDAMAMDPNFNPVISPVLDLTALTQEANKMSAILATAPIMAGVSYQTAAEISALTNPSPEDGSEPDDGGSGGDQYNELQLHLHSPKPIDSVETYRAGKTLISIAKEALS